MAHSKESPIFTSLGLFIIDDNEYPSSSGKETEYNVIGGGVSYAAIGGRIVGSAKKGHLISGIIDKGSDFQIEVEDEINSWGTGLVIRSDESRLTSRGVNIYDENDIRHFKYQTPKKRIEVEDILETKNLVHSSSFHMCCSMDRCGLIIDTLLEKHFESKSSSNPNSKPKFIFEPTPDACIKDNFDELKKVLEKVDVFSPNLNEACELVGVETLPEEIDQIERVAEKFTPYLTQPGSGLVLRCGPMGCYIKSKSLSIMLPAYHIDQSNVVDVTGGGNSFCGAFITSLILSKGDWLISGIFGNVVSGCVIEKLGVPKVTNGDRWNGLTVQERLESYLNKDSLQLRDKVDIHKIDWF